jgi:hypothetical protein
MFVLYFWNAFLSSTRFNSSRKPNRMHRNVSRETNYATDWKTVDLPEEITYYLLLQNRLHFGQAHGTPFTKPSLLHKINWMASTETAKLILHGDFDSSELMDLQALLLHHCQHQDATVLPSLITAAEFISKFKCWNKATSTSPSGMHLGHYKALVM